MDVIEGGTEDFREYERGYGVGYKVGASPINSLVELDVHRTQHWYDHTDSWKKGYAIGHGSGNDRREYLANLDERRTRTRTPGPGLASLKGRVGSILQGHLTSMW